VHFFLKGLSDATVCTQVSKYFFLRMQAVMHQRVFHVMSSASSMYSVKSNPWNLRNSHSTALHYLLVLPPPPLPGGWALVWQCPLQTCAKSNIGTGGTGCWEVWETK
jgi:hypothetical protein